MFYQIVSENTGCVLQDEVMNKIREDYLPGCGYKIYQDPAEFTFTTDSVFLAHFPHLANKAKVLELGCGTGAISFYLAARGATEVTGLDVNPRMVELFNHSAEDNGIFWENDDIQSANSKEEKCKASLLSKPKVRALQWDIKEIKNFCPTESFDLVVANPPYRNSGRERSIGTSACHEKTAVLEDFFAAAAYALHSRGRFALVQLPERFMESMELAIKYNLQPKKLQWVHASVDKPAWIFLLEMVKNGSYGLEVLPPLIMYNADGTLTEQAKKQMEKDY
jgi:tRNA1(Val) A37 N6-methylase TrmN6